MSRWAKAAPTENSTPYAVRWVANSRVAPAAVGAHQHRCPSVLVAGPQRRRLRQRGIQDREVIDGGVRAGPARAQQLPDRLPTGGATVVDEPQQGVEAKPLSPGPGRVGGGSAKLDL